MSVEKLQPIPAIDLINGQCVRLFQGDYAQKTIYDGQPLELALRYEDAGLKRLHLVDLDGAKAGSPQHLSVLELIAQRTSLKVDFGGGIRTKEQAQSVLDAGASQITVGSLAIQQPDLFSEWLTFFGADRILLAADVRQEMLATNGWLKQTNVSIFEALRNWIQQGLKWCFCTDIGHDGTFAGPSLVLYSKIREEFPSLHLIASGGVSKIQDLDACAELGMSGVIIGKALLEGKITLAELLRWQAS